MAFVSIYADEIKSDTKYAGYTLWYCANYPLDLTYKDSEKSGAGDIVTGMAKCITVLRYGNGSREDKIFHLKPLIHFLGDLHQPLHVERAGNRGAMTFHCNGSMSGRIFINYGIPIF